MSESETAAIKPKEAESVAPAAVPNENGWVPTTIWNRPFIFCCVAGIFQYLGLQMSHGILSRYTESLGGDAVAVGIVTGIFAVTAMGFKILSGPAIDAFDHKKILSIFMVVLGLAFFGCTISNSVAGVGASMLLRGVAQAFSGTVNLVLVAVYLPKDKMGQGIAYFGVAQAVCQAIGPSISLTLSVYIGYKATYAIAGALEILGALSVLLINQPSHGTQKFHISLKSVIAKEAIVPMLILALTGFPYASILAFLVLDGVAKGIPQEQMGLFFTVFAIVTLVTRPFFGRLSDKVGTKKTLLPVLVVMAVSYILLPSVETLFGYCVVAVLNAIGTGVSMPVAQALALRLVPQERYAAASNTCYIGNDIGFIFGPIISGWLVNMFGYSGMWYCMIVPCAVTFLVLALVRLPKGA